MYKTISILLLAFSVFFYSCSTDETPEVRNEAFIPTASDSLQYAGMFTSDAHPTSGDVKVYKNDASVSLIFEDLKSDNGPDLRVYLSTSTGIGDFIEVGELKAVTGNFSYDLDANTDLDKYNHVLIWCEDFSVLFGHSVLEKQ